MEMESVLFIQNLKSPELITLVSQNIGRVSDGSSSHCAGALKLGLKKGIELKKQNKGVMLRCNLSICRWHNTNLPYSAVGSAVFCPTCVNVRGNYYMRCTGCERTRGGSYSSCQYCAKRFV